MPPKLYFKPAMSIKLFAWRKKLKKARRKEIPQIRRMECPNERI